MMGICEKNSRYLVYAVDVTTFNSVMPHCSCFLFLVKLHASSSKRSGSNLPDLSQRSFPSVPASGYDMVVIGSGPGGEAAAVRSAQLGARVAVIEKRSAFGGPTGLTSKAVREAAKRICKAVDQVGQHARSS